MVCQFDGHPLQPRRGGLLRVLIIVRISTEHQDARSLDDQVALCKQYVTSRYSGAVEFQIIAGRGSGEHLDRKELLQAEEVVEGRTVDLVITEDLGRICRRMYATAFCEACEDSDTRLIAINDSIDTARPDWRTGALFAAFKHESGNKDTANRIRRTLRNRFLQGDVVQTIQYGYVKKPGSSRDGDVSKLPDAERIYDQIFTRLENGASYSEVADWMNAEHVPTGEWNRLQKWDGRMVARLVNNPILKGERRRNQRMSKRHNKTGRRKSVLAPPSERLSRVVPHLMFIPPERYDRLIAKLARQNGHYARGRLANQPDPRAAVSKKLTNWPGQHIRCGICGRLMYWGGHGQTEAMMCAGVREYQCWNVTTFHGPRAAKAIISAVLNAIEALPDFDTAFRQQVEVAARECSSGRDEACRRLRAEVRQVDQEIQNVTNGIAQIGFSEQLGIKLREREVRRAELHVQLCEFESRPVLMPELPPISVVRVKAHEHLDQANFADPNFRRLMMELVPRLEVFPCKLIDGRDVVQRAKVTLTLAPLLGTSALDGNGVVLHEMMVDLFDPPQREAYRTRIVAQREAGRTEREIAQQYGLTITAVQRGMALHRLMQAHGRTDAYEYQTHPLDNQRANARPRHARYQFSPLPGYPANLLFRETR